MFVTKKSRKPFKSRSKVARVVESVTHPITGRPAYLLDDGSVVEQQKCQPYEGDPCADTTN